MIRKTLLLALLLSPYLAAIHSDVSAETWRHLKKAPRVDFAETLSLNQLVVDGQLVSADTETVSPERRPATLRVRIRVRSVLLGALAESTVTIHDLAVRYVPETLTPGSEVIGWGVYDYSERWHLYGGVVVKVGDRLLRSGHKMEGVWLKGMDPDSSATYEQVLAALRPWKEKQSTASFEHSSAVGLVRIRSIHPLTPGDTNGSVAVVDSLGWLFGRAASLPDTISLLHLVHCEYVGQGDTLLVPVQKVSAGRRASFNVCPDAILVRNGYVLGFGVPLSAMGKLLRYEHGEVVLPAIVSSRARRGE